MLESRLHPPLGNRRVQRPRTPNVARKDRHRAARPAGLARFAIAIGGLAIAACSPSTPPSTRWPSPSALDIASGDWPSYNRDLAGTRYSSLAEINASNVADLEVAWIYPLGRNTTTDSLSGGSETTPLVIEGVMFVAAADRIVALRAESGEELWRYTVEHGSPSRRGVAYWPGESDAAARVFFTAGRRLIALEAATGRKAIAFGADGEVEMPVVYNAAPTRFGNLLIVGSNSPPGSVRAFDALTGSQVWVFHSVPRPGEVGYETWAGDARVEQPNVLHWPFSFTIDVDRALLYAAFESPGPGDYFGGDRPGANLFGNSIVALDARTGRRRWHFQTVHHDIWDYDLPAPPALLDVTIGDERVPVLAEAGKSGYLYLLNRVTGEPVFGVEERPVPPSDVPGEKAAPTQPIPLKPPPIARVDYAADDLVTAEETNAEHAKFCRALRDRGGPLQNAGPFTPFRFRAEGQKPRTTLVFPGSLGGANWGGTAVDPALGLVFVNTMDAGSLGWIEAVPASLSDAAPVSGEGTPASAPAYRRMSAVGGPLARFWWNDGPPDSGGNELSGGERAWPCQKPPWGRLLAVNAVTGDVVWQTPLGITEQLPESKQRTGRPNIGGPIATAGGLVLIGATNDRRFRAFDSRTGEELWSTRLPLSAHAVPITYLGADGKQYVAVAAAGAGAIDDPESPEAQVLIAWALPH
jgi:quinoprotein glucose dehydrogenase